MAGQFKTKYYCEMNIYYLIVKLMTSMAVNLMFKCKEFNLPEANEVIFQLQDSSHTGVVLNGGIWCKRGSGFFKF